MKKQITRLSTLVCAATLTTGSFAQTTAMMPGPVFDAKNNLEYAFTADDNTPPATSAVPYSAVSPKARQSFDKSFKDAANAQWYALDKRTYLATFTSKDGRDSRAAFSKNGYMYYAISNGDEKSLPKEERHVIKSNYIDYNISRVAEVNADGQKIWVVNLEDDDNVVVARTEKGSLDELARFKTHMPEKKHRKGKVIIPQ